MSPEIAQIANLLIALILSLSIHEAAHAFAAFRLGDNTAKDMGRLTLNPLPHIDPLGTIILPLMMSVMGGGFFGWAKPVPVDTRNLRDPRFGYMMVAAAGPISNIILCFLSIVALHVYAGHFTDTIPRGSFLYPFIDLLRAMVFVNALLAVFNLIPLPPLDGGTIFSSVLPTPLRDFYASYIEPYGMWILLFLIISGGLRFLPIATDRMIQTMSSIVGTLI